MDSKRDWIFFGVLLTISVAFLSLVSLPVIQKNRQLARDLETQRDLVVQATPLIPVTEELDKRVQETVRYNQKWNPRLKTLNELPKVFAAVLLASEEGGVTLKSFAPQPLSPKRQITPVQLNLDCQGTFSEAIKFLHLLEKEEMLIWVKEIRLGTELKDNDDLNCSVKLTIFARNPELSD